MGQYILTGSHNFAMLRNVSESMAGRVSILSAADGKGLKAFRETYPQQDIAPGVIVYAGDTCRYVADDIIAVPWNGCG